MSEIEENLFMEFWNKLNFATDLGIKQSSNSNFDEDFRQVIQKNNAIFATFKTHRMSSDMSKLLLDLNGDLKPFERWVKDVRPIADHQVYNWFKTEYVTAVNRARHAANWKEFQRTSEALPNLKWRPSTAASPREVHAMFYGLVLPINHPFWHQHSPGDMWNCQCGLLATDEERTPEDKIPTAGYARAKGLDNNPADDGKLISDSHPYFPSKCSTCKLNKSAKALGITNKLIYNAKSEKDCYTCPLVLKVVDSLIDNKIASRKQYYEQLLEDENYHNVQFDTETGGLMATHKNHNFDKKDGVFEVNAQLAGYNAGNSVVLEKEDHTQQNVKNTEGLWNGYLFEVAGATTATDNNIRNALKHCASKKKTEIAVLYFKKDMFNKEVFKEGLKKYYGLKKNKGGQYVEFKQIICVQEDRIIYMIK